jgi:septal ring factor EnvC (AmiA/AmiB activator)
MGFISNVIAKVKGAEGSVFTKIEQAETKVSEAKGRLIAAAKTFESHNKEIAWIETEVNKVHATASEIHSKLDSLLAKL